jgi:uncharacterized protein (TIGR02284 family)
MNTTTSSVPNDRRAIVALNRLVETCINGEKGYAIAAADARDPALKRSLMTFSEQRAAFVASLQAQIRELGGTPENEGSAAGTLHRGWVGIRKAIEGRSDRLLVDECLIAEEWARKRYIRGMNALALANWSTGLRLIIEEQYAGIRLAEVDLTRWLEGAEK